jgi:hypothetical protein
MPGSVGTFSLAGDDASLRKEAALRCFRFVKIAQSVSPTFQTKGNRFPSGAGPHTTNKSVNIKKDDFPIIQEIVFLLIQMQLPSLLMMLSQQISNLEIQINQGHRNSSRTRDKSFTHISTKN